MIILLLLLWNLCSSNAWLHVFSFFFYAFLLFHMLSPQSEYPFLSFKLPNSYLFDKKQEEQFFIYEVFSGFLPPTENRSHSSRWSYHT